MTEVKNFNCEFSFKKNQDLSEMAEQMKKYHKHPFLNHFLEAAKFESNCTNFSKILLGLKNYFESIQDSSAFTKLYNLVNMISKFRGEITLDSIEKNSSILDNIDFD